MDYLTTLYVFLLAAVIGFAFISKIPSLLQATFLSASSLMNSLALIGAMFALSQAQTQAHIMIACIAVALATANLVGSYLLAQSTLKSLPNNSNTDSGDH